ncbi:MAG: ABC transporter ATP-binding protein/permease [Lachnospiraceae bacterium]|nr:ABC transporter ATP-binding protein/permease [Lachnospiraceae bacterium]
MKFILKEMGKKWYLYLIGFIALFSSVYLDNLLPKYTKNIVDDVIMGGKVEILTSLLMAILGIGIGRMFLQYIKEVSFDTVGCMVASNYRQHIFKHVQKLSVPFFDKTNTGEIMARLTGDVDAVWGSIGFLGMLVVEVIFHVILVVKNMLGLCPRLAVLPLLCMPLVAGISIILESKVGKIYDKISDANVELNTVCEENISGVRTVKSFTQEKFEIGKFISKNKRYYELSVDQSKTFIKYYPYIQMVSQLLTIATILYGGVLVMSSDPAKQISLGTLSAFIQYCGYIVWPMEMLGWLGNEFASGFASIKKINKIMSEKPEIVNKENAIELEDVKGEITFENVGLKIGEAEILKNISFSVKPGQTLGIMGETGSGKSSLINVLMRYYDPTEGKVLLDGHDLRDITLSSIRGSVAPVTQDVFLFSDTISENVKFGKKSEITDEQVSRALKDSMCAEFVDKYEEKAETLIGERGVGLSGGQKQRISIARAFARNEKILIMDDSTSALDMETESEIQKVLQGMTDITKFIVAHRISAVRHADEIIVLKDGEIAERGTHEELLSLGGLYYETYESQYGE